MKKEMKYKNVIDILNKEYLHDDNYFVNHIRTSNFLMPVRKKRKQLQVKKQLAGNFDRILLDKKILSKRDYVKKIEKHFPEKFSEVGKEIKKIISGKSYKNAEDMIFDIYYEYFVHGYLPEEYICYDFINTSEEERKKFMSDQESIIFGYKMNDINAICILMNKYLTYKLYEDYYKRDLIRVKNRDDYHEYKNFIEKNKIFVEKESTGSCGRGIRLVSLKDNLIDEENYFNELIDAGVEVILEEPIYQDSYMAKLNKDSVNTVRIITMYGNEGIEPIFSFMKVGREGSFVDNGGAGGFFVSIDIEKGIFNTDAVNEKGERYEKHPDNGCPFKGFELPDWDKAINLCKEMASEFPIARCIGFDIAYNDKKEWIIVEANGLTQVIGPQSTMINGIKSKLDSYL